MENNSYIQEIAKKYGIPINLNEEMIVLAKIKSDFEALYISLMIKSGNFDNLEKTLEDFEQDFGEDFENLFNMLMRNIKMDRITNDYNVGFCPKCKGSLWQNNDECNYCFRCGQKIRKSKFRK